MFQGFKEFILRGNVIELAVAVVIGAAFTTIVNALVEGIFNPLIGALFNADSLSTSMRVGLPGGAALAFGAVLAAVIQFLLIAVVVYFVFVFPMNTFKERQAARAAAGKPVESPAAETETELLIQIRDLLAGETVAAANTGSVLGDDRTVTSPITGKHTL